jgi:hypothetical protein
MLPSNADHPRMAACTGTVSRLMAQARQPAMTDSAAGDRLLRLVASSATVSATPNRWRASGVADTLIATRGTPLRQIYTGLHVIQLSLWLS